MLLERCRQGSSASLCSVKRVVQASELPVVALTPLNSVRYCRVHHWHQAACHVTSQQMLVLLLHPYKPQLQIVAVLLHGIAICCPLASQSYRAVTSD